MSRELLTTGLASIRSRLQSSEVIVGLVLAIIVGVMAGFGALLFRWLIKSFQSLFFDGGSQLFSFLGQYYVILLPVLGGLLVGPIIYFFAREAKGHGVPEVMEAVAMRGGRIRPRVAVIKSLASSICIGSGGSVGREGPIVQIGSAAGSTIGQWLKLPDETVRVLVACGAAGGISATFNAPIAGVFFALEVILGRVVTRRFAYVVVSSVIADFVTHSFLGDEPAFAVPQFGLVSNWEIGFYAILGIVAALVAVGFTILVYKSEDLFDGLKMPEYLKPALGGIAVGLIGLYNHDLFGVGYDGIQSALAGQIAIETLVILFFLKIVATSFTLGSGGSGGIFAPCLFLGTMLGTILGTVFHGFFPDITAPAGAYGIVGMAAVFAGATSAPFSAILIVFEMTGVYPVILPLMTAVAISTILSRMLKHETIYTLKLLRRGVDLEREELGDLMKGITVEEAMTKDFPTVPSTMPVEELIKRYQKTGHHGFPVLDENYNLAGIVTQADVERYITMNQEQGQVTVEDIATKSPFVAFPDQTLDRVIGMAEEEYGRIPVVSREDRRHLVGVLRRHDIIRAYRKKARKKVLRAA